MVLYMHSHQKAIKKMYYTKRLRDENNKAVRSTFSRQNTYHFRSLKWCWFKLFQIQK